MIATRHLVLVTVLIAATGAVGNRCDSAELAVLVPVTAGKAALSRPGPKGGTASPVLRRTTTGALVQAILREGQSGTVKFALDLDAAAQTIAGAKTLAPTYLLVADEMGGFARHGFWLSGKDNQLTWHDEPYVNMVVDQGSLSDGSFEEEFAHEMGHVLLRRMVPKLPDGLSRTPHSSLAITDYPTAFDEGFAIHMQGLARLLTQNSRLQAEDRGRAYKPFLSYWQSNIDREFRIHGMRSNLFVAQQKPMPLQMGDATSQFDLTHFKNGQQMMSSEGMIATLFYQIMLAPNDKATQRAERYRLLLESLHSLNAQKLTSSTPFFIRLLQLQDAKSKNGRARWIGVFLDLTYGATASRTVIDRMTELAALGHEGKGEDYAALLKTQRSGLAALTKQAIARPQILDDAIGPELWIAITQGEEVATVNLNTAEESTLTQRLNLAPLDAELLLADRRANGPFKSVDDFVARRKASPTLTAILAAGAAEANKLGGYARQ